MLAFPVLCFALPYLVIPSCYLISGNWYECITPTCCVHLGSYICCSLVLVLSLFLAAVTIFAHWTYENFMFCLKNLS